MGAVYRWLCRYDETSALNSGILMKLLLPDESQFLVNYSEKFRTSELARTYTYAHATTNLSYIYIVQSLNMEAE